ncbi:hypothetical protein BDK51DRAFT_1541, partial [Blyttiomyces helicus]
PGSRLFVGNLAAEKTDKRQVADLFAQFGNIAEITFKGTFGFVQFESVEACQRAI